MDLFINEKVFSLSNWAGDTICPSAMSIFTFGLLCLHTIRFICSLMWFPVRLLMNCGNALLHSLFRCPSSYIWYISGNRSLTNMAFFPLYTPGILISVRCENPSHPRIGFINGFGGVLHKMSSESTIGCRNSSNTSSIVIINFAYPSSMCLFNISIESMTKAVMP